ncbi:AbiH family protein [Listeria monocytogenes]|nr:hypothetical protein [Listeria monocytogenes]
MSKRLFIIGNGFDLSHNLPTRFNPDFKLIAKKNEQISCFWDFYQSQEIDIWSDFENLLAKPDFNELDQIFEGYEPGYSSDYERDRNAIITQVDLNGNLIDSLYEFAIQAEQQINKAAIRQACSSANSDILSYLPVLGEGEAILSGVDFSMPLSIKIDEPRVPPDSNTPLFSKK